MKKLTIIIPTYNRKQPLLEQLRSLELQGHFDEYEILVSDNHSDYNVEEWLKSNLSHDILEIINVTSRPYNVGGDLNVTLSVQLPSTEWVCLLSDDDIIEPKGLETILNDIDKYNETDVIWLKYSIAGGFVKNINCTCSNLVEIFDYYSSGKIGAGQFYFVGNNVYRLKALRPYFTDSCIYSDNAMPHVLLPLYAIKYGKGKMVLSSECLTNYTVGRATYASIWAALRFSNILFSSLYLDTKEIKAFKRVEFFSIISVIDSMANVNDRSLRWEYFKKIFTGHYRLFSFKGWAFIVSYIGLLVLGAKQWKLLREKKLL